VYALIVWPFKRWLITSSLTSTHSLGSLVAPHCLQPFCSFFSKETSWSLIYICLFPLYLQLFLDLCSFIIFFAIWLDTTRTLLWVMKIVLKFTICLLSVYFTQNIVYSISVSNIQNWVIICLFPQLPLQELHNRCLSSHWKNSNYAQLLAWNFKPSVLLQAFKCI